MHFFDISNGAFTVLNYQVSYVELIGTIFGLLSVFYASKANILTWGTGIINEIFFFILFFQVHLYADMFLQMYFFVVTIYGWYNWSSEISKHNIRQISHRNRLLLGGLIIILSIISGFVISNIHHYLPYYFKTQAAYPFADSLIMIMSIVATVLLAKKIIENWYLWIFTDVLCVVLYAKKEVYFLTVEYFLFLILAILGLYNWKKDLMHD